MGEWKEVPLDYNWHNQDGVHPRFGSMSDERDPSGRNSKEPGSKLDMGKTPIFQGLLDYFPLACLAVADVSAQGAAKYSWKGWESVPDGIKRYSDALVRHIVYETIDGAFDKDGFRHAAQIAWNALAVLELKLRNEKCT
jgi:hypothetical protein